MPLKNGRRCSTAFSLDDPLPMDEPTDIPELYTEHADAYQRFVRSLGYPQGLRAAFLKSPALVPDMHILDAGCGTGITTLALRQALEARGISNGEIDAFDLVPAMLDRFRARLARFDIENVRLAQADVLNLDTLPPTWSDYDLVVTASMLEYVVRSKLPTALRALRQRLRSGGTLLLFTCPLDTFRFRIGISIHGDMWLRRGRLLAHSGVWSKSIRSASAESGLAVRCASRNPHDRIEARRPVPRRATPCSRYHGLHGRYPAESPRRHP